MMTPWVARVVNGQCAGPFSSRIRPYPGGIGRNFPDHGP